VLTLLMFRQVHFQTRNGVLVLQSMNLRKRRTRPIETLDSNIVLETQGNTMDMDKNNIGVANAETEREENQPTDTLKTNLHQAHTESNSKDGGSGKHTVSC
jgi:hypothetical protein